MKAKTKGKSKSKKQTKPPKPQAKRFNPKAKAKALEQAPANTDALAREKRHTTMIVNIIKSMRDASMAEKVVKISDLDVIPPSFVGSYPAYRKVLIGDDETKRHLIEEAYAEAEKIQRDRSARFRERYCTPEVTDVKPKKEIVRVFGYTAEALVRWLSRDAWTLPQIRATVEAYNIELTKKEIRHLMRQGITGHCAIPSLTPMQVEILYETLHDLENRE